MKDFLKEKIDDIGQHITGVLNKKFNMPLGPVQYYANTQIISHWKTIEGEEGCFITLKKETSTKILMSIFGPNGTSTLFVTNKKNAEEKLVKLLIAQHKEMLTFSPYTL